MYPNSQTFNKISNQKAFFALNLTKQAVLSTNLLAFFPVAFLKKTPGGRVLHVHAFGTRMKKTKNFGMKIADVF
jgi:hypothetical protein